MAEFDSRRFWTELDARVRRLIQEDTDLSRLMAWSRGGKLSGGSIGGVIPLASVPAHASTHNAGGSDELATMTGDSGSGGVVGFVPAPAAGDAAAGKYLRADATWTVPAGGAGSITVEEADGSPSVADVTKVKVSNGTLTDDGSGVVTILTGSHTHVMQEDLSASCNGVTTVFTLANTYEAATTRVSLNGVIQRPGAGNSYTETGSGTTITFATAPLSGDELLVAYIEAGATGGGGTGGMSGDTAPADIYVTTTGNDTTGDGTSGNPYATIAKALSILPDILTIGHTIHVSDGTYAEGILLNRFRSNAGTALTVLGNTTTPANVQFTGTVTDADGTVAGCACGGAVVVSLMGMEANVTAANGVYVHDRAWMTLDTCTISGILTQGITAQHYAKIVVKNAVTVSGWTAFGIELDYYSEMIQQTAGTLTVTGPNTGSGWGIHIFEFSHFYTDNFASLNVTVQNCEIGFQLGLHSQFAFSSSGGTVTISNASRYTGSIGVQCTDLSDWSTGHALVLANMDKGFDANSICYQEASGTRTVTNVGTLSTASQNSVAYMP